MKYKSGQVLKRQLWKVMSEWIRRKDADINGYVKCVTCGCKKHWKEMDAGHYIPKTAGLGMYFCENNIHPQCTYCNRFLHGNIQRYAIFMQETYGNQILKLLEHQRHQIVSISPMEYTRLIEYYKNKINKL